MKSFDQLYNYILENNSLLKIHKNILKIPMNKPYGFWMDRHGNFVVVNGGLGAHETIGKELLDELNIPYKKSVYETLFANGWMRILLKGKTYYEFPGNRLSNMQTRNLEFINDIYELSGVEEG